MTGLHHAAGGGHPECFHCLLEHGADPSVCTLNGDNALDIARKRGKPRIISKASKVNWSCYMYTHYSVASIVHEAGVRFQFSERERKICREGDW